MATITPSYITQGEYLELERQAQTKSEYLNGDVFAVSGGTASHALIAPNLVGELRQKLTDRPSKTFTSDLRVKVSSSGLYTYPDVTVVCGELELADGPSDTVTNPILLVALLSESTINYGEKFDFYRELPSLVEYLTVAQDKVQIEQHTRQVTGQWLLTETKDPGAVLILPSLAVEIRVVDIYEKVEFPNKEA